MGNRGNIVMQFPSKKKVFLYTHWRGRNIGNIVRKALKRRQRWDDPQYLTRIMFDTLTEGAQGAETGAGISPEIGDNGYNLLVLDTEKQEVREEEEKTKVVVNRWTFEEFIALPDTKED